MHVFAVLQALTIGFWSINALGAIDLVAAYTNAFNGALLARRPDHYKHFTVSGVMLLAVIGGIGGGVMRDILLNKVPAPLVNPWYLIGTILLSAAAISIDWQAGQRFREGLFQFMTAFSLPWYAIVGASKALDAHLPDIAAVLIGITGATFGRYVIDISCGVPPKQLVRGEFFVGAAALTAIVFTICRNVGLSLASAAALAFVAGFGFRILAQTFGWEELEPWEPQQLQAGEAPRKPLPEHLREELREPKTR